MRIFKWFFGKKSNSEQFENIENELTSEMRQIIRNFFDEYLTLVGPFFESYRFYFDKGKKAFVKKFDWGFQLVRIHKAAGIQVYLTDFVINHNALNAIDKYTYNVKRTSFTMFASLNSLVNGIEPSFFITTDEERKEGAEKTKEVFTRLGIPFFERFDSLSKIEQFINAGYENMTDLDSFDHDKFTPNALDTIFLGLSAARLMNKPSYPALEAKYMLLAREKSSALYENLEKYMIRFNEVDFDKIRAKYSIDAN